MDARLDGLLKLAWRTVPGRLANEAILKARAATALGEDALRNGKLEEAASPEVPQEPEEDAPLARAYEIALSPEETFDTFTGQHLPRLVYHLESIGAHLPHVGGVVLCVFVGDQLHFLHTGEALAEIARLLGLTQEELAARYGTHELRTAVRGTPLALPGALNDRDRP